MAPSVIGRSNRAAPDIGTTRFGLRNAEWPPRVSRMRVRMPRAASRPNRLPPEKKTAQRRPNVESSERDAVSYVADAPPRTSTTVGTAESKRTTVTPDRPSGVSACPTDTPATEVTSRTMRGTVSVRASAEKSCGELGSPGRFMLGRAWGRGHAEISGGGGAKTSRHVGDSPPFGRIPGRAEVAGRTTSAAGRVPRPRQASARASHRGRRDAAGEAVRRDVRGDRRRGYEDVRRPARAAQDAPCGAPSLEAGALAGCGLHRGRCGPPSRKFGAGPLPRHLPRALPHPPTLGRRQPVGARRELHPAPDRDRGVSVRRRGGPLARSAGCLLPGISPGRVDLR